MNFPMNDSEIEFMTLICYLILRKDLSQGLRENILDLILCLILQLMQLQGYVAMTNSKVNILGLQHTNIIFYQEKKLFILSITTGEKQTTFQFVVFISQIGQHLGVE